MILRLTLLSASALALNTSLALAEEARVLDPVEVTGLRAVEADRATTSVSVLTVACRQSIIREFFAPKLLKLLLPPRPLPLQRQSK
jgi:hypothetical protein